ncbi:hypothetical protein AB1E18_003788 [Capra hircus]
MLENLLSESKTIFVESCLAQAFFVFTTGGTEACLLAVMAYDRYVAISSPLLYGKVMNNQLCVGLVWGSWGLAFVDALINILLAVNLDYCEDQTIPHFSCELSSLFPLSCSDTSTNFTLLLCSSVLHFFGTFVMIASSYARIVSTVLSISSTSGRSKAFSTCSSHLTTVILFYGSGFLSYLLPASGSALEMIFSLQYSVITPMLNPLIYSLQNKELPKQKTVSTPGIGKVVDSLAQTAEYVLDPGKPCSVKSFNNQQVKAALQRMLRHQNLFTLQLEVGTL